MKIFCIQYSINNGIGKLSSLKISEQLIYADLVNLIVFFYFNFKNLHLDDSTVSNTDFKIGFNIENLKKIFLEMNKNMNMILKESEITYINFFLNEKPIDLMSFFQEQCLNKENMRPTI